ARTALVCYASLSIMPRRPPSPALFPYTTLFRSPNGPGITMLVMLNILSRFDLTRIAPLSVERFHLEAEAARIAYMMREQHIGDRSEEHTSELQSRENLVCRLLLEKKKHNTKQRH